MINKLMYLNVNEEKQNIENQGHTMSNRKNS
jgi:hypothetical protein